MELRIIKTKKQYQEYLDWIDKQFDAHVKPDSSLGEKVEVALLLVKQYEDANYRIPFPNPIDAIKLKMEEKGMKAKDLEAIIGSKGHVSSILSGRREITLKMAQRLKDYFNLPATIFLKSA